MFGDKQALGKNWRVDLPNLRAVTALPVVGKQGLGWRNLAGPDSEWMAKRQLKAAGKLAERKPVVGPVAQPVVAESP